MRVSFDEERTVAVLKRQNRKLSGIASLGASRTISKAISSDTDVGLKKAFDFAETLGVNTYDILNDSSREIVRENNSVYERDNLLPSNTTIQLCRFREPRSVANLLSTQGLKHSTRFFDQPARNDKEKTEWDFLRKIDAYNEFLKPEVVWVPFGIKLEQLASLKPQLSSIDELFNDIGGIKASGIGLPTEDRKASFDRMMDLAGEVDSIIEKLSGVEGANHRLFFCPLDRESHLLREYGFWDSSFPKDQQVVDSYGYSIRPKKLTNLIVVAPKRTSYVCVVAEAHPVLIRRYEFSQVEEFPDYFPEFTSEHHAEEGSE